MNLTFEALRADYQHRLETLTITAQAQANAIARRLIGNRDRFIALQDQCGVPCLWIMPVFERECPSFEAYLGNGDPLNKPTVHVPKDRGPFPTWEAGAIDALTLDHVTEVKSWTWEMACYEWEKYNGFGPRLHGRLPGYLWSGTDQYQGGKYISDGVWSRGTWDRQLGCVAIAKAIAHLDPELLRRSFD
jgi:lysozyme family protein